MLGEGEERVWTKDECLSIRSPAKSAPGALVSFRYFTWAAACASPIVVSLSFHCHDFFTISEFSAQGLGDSIDRVNDMKVCRGIDDSNACEAASVTRPWTDEWPVNTSDPNEEEILSRCWRGEAVMWYNGLLRKS